MVFQEGSIVEDVPADEFWRRTPDELHAEGLRGSCRFAPQVKEHRADAQYIISPFRSSDGEFTLNIPELKIPKGAVVAVLGNNGAGKSTFARCLCGLVRKCKVQIIDGEKRYAGRKLSSLAYMVFQDVNHQLFSESVSEDVTLGLTEAEACYRRRTGGTKGYYLLRRTHQRSRLPKDSSISKPLYWPMGIGSGLVMDLQRPRMASPAAFFSLTVPPGINIGEKPSSLGSIFLLRWSISAR